MLDTSFAVTGSNEKRCRLLFALIMCMGEKWHDVAGITRWNQILKKKKKGPSLFNFSKIFLGV